VASTAAPPATRDRILDAALRLFSGRGTSAVSMRELAEAAEVTVPGLYYHFVSKAELIRALYTARGHGGADDGEGEEPRSTRVTERIIEQAHHAFERLVLDADFLRLMQREAALGDTDALEVGATLAAAWRARWRDVLAGADDIDPSADLDLAAACITTFLWGLFLEYLNHGDPSVIVRADGFARLLAPSLTGTRA